MKYFIIVLMFIAQNVFAAGNQWFEKTVDVSSEEKNPTLAKRELIEKAIDKVSEELIKEIIGEAKYTRNYTLIQNKIIKNSARYVPFTRPGELQPEPVGFKLTVNMKISQEDLQTMLLENGLFYDSDSTPILLPVITISDKVSGRSWGWWQDKDLKKSDLQKISRSFEIGLKNSFWKNNFYVIKPHSLHYQEMLPRVEEKSFFSSQPTLDWQSIADLWNAQILVQGEVAISKNRQRSDSYLINIHLVANQVQNGRSIAEVVRQYETDLGKQDFVVEQKLKEVIELVSQDLSSQVLEAWQKGTIGSSLFRLSILGRVPMQMQDNIKSAIKNQVHEIKNIKERLISMDEFVLEVDTNILPKDLQQKMPRMSVNGYVLKFDSANEKEAIYKWSKEIKE